MKKMEMVSKVIGKSNAEKLAVKFFKACPGYNPKLTEEQYLKQYPSAKIVSSSKLLPELFNVYYCKKKPEEIVPDESVPRASVHVPYHVGVTDMLIFNFLQRNYGIRDPILIRLSILVGEKCFWAKQYLLVPNEVKYLKNFSGEVDPGTLPKQGIVMLEAFHPRIKTPGNEFRFFMFFNNPAKGTISGIHSIPVFLEPYAKRDSFCYRAFIPGGQPAYYCNFADPHQVLESNGAKGIFRRAQSQGPIKGSMGFCIAHDEGGLPTTLWHDNCSNNMREISHIPSKEKTPQACVTAFYVPDFELNAPLINVNEEEIGFITRSFLVKAYREGGEFIGEKFVTLSDDELGFDLAQVFKAERIKGSVYFVVDFQRDQDEFPQKPPCYLHLYYRRGDNFADQVHTQYSFGYHNDSFGLPKSYRCLKMAPLFKEFRTIYGLATVGGARKNPDNTITLRVFTDKGTEHVLNNYPLNIPDGISTIHGDDLIKEIGASMNEAAVVWFEHPTTNFNGSWFLINRRTGHLATDHCSGA